MRPMMLQSFAGQVLPIGFTHVDTGRVVSGQMSLINGMPYIVNGTVGHAPNNPTTPVHPWQTLNGFEYDFYHAPQANAEIVIEFPTVVQLEGIQIATTVDATPFSFPIEVEGWEERINPLGEWRRLILPTNLNRGQVPGVTLLLTDSFPLRKFRVRGLSGLYIYSIYNIF